METPQVVGNWKSHFTVEEALGWLDEYQQLVNRLAPPLSFKPAVCAPFTVLAPMGAAIKERSLPLALGAQNLSPYPEGAYTGEVSGRMLQGLADLVLIGHSERKKLFGESMELVGQKLTLALQANLTPILCAASFAEIPAKARNDPRTIVMFEPPAAISRQGQYCPVNLQEVKKVIEEWRAKLNPQTKLFYGGSVNQDNVVDYFRVAKVDGVVPGHASLKPASFVALLKKLNSFLTS